MTQVETEQDRVGKGLVQILASCFLDVTSEATAPVRYQEPHFRADLTDLVYSIFLCVLARCGLSPLSQLEFPQNVFCWFLRNFLHCL